MGLPLEVPPLALLLADVEQTDRGLGPIEVDLGDHCPHDGELDEVFRFHVDVGAGVEDDGGDAEREDRGDGGAGDAGDPPDDDGRRGHGGPGRSGGHHAVGFAFGDEAGGDGNRRLPFGPRGGGGIFSHSDRLGGVDHGKDRARLGKLGVEQPLIADEHHVYAAGGSVESTQHGLARGVVPAHRVERYSSHVGLRWE